MTTSYDSQNRLVSVYQGANEVATYTYDSAGRRHSKTLASSGSTTTYLYDNDTPANVLVEYQNGTWVRAFVYGPGTDQPLCMLTNPALAGIEPDGTIYYYHQDALGNVIALSDSTGALVERYSYDVFGKPEQASTVGNPYMFTGRRYDIESGLYYYRARMYHPGLGRFLQTDPIGYEDGINWYAYCGNNPIKSSDPIGNRRKRNELRSAAKGWVWGIVLGVALDIIAAVGGNAPLFVVGMAITVYSTYRTFRYPPIECIRRRNDPNDPNNQTVPVIPDEGLGSGIGGPVRRVGWRGSTG